MGERTPVWEANKESDKSLCHVLEGEFAFAIVDSFEGRNVLIYV